MWNRDLFGPWWNRAAIGALALLILGAGLCCVGQNSMDDHAILQDLCPLVLLVPAVILPLTGLLAGGVAVSLRRPAFAAVPLSVPKPPPRRSRLA
jgi:hypothetical protein